MSLLRARLEARSRALLMGILNVTPDSFSDGGRFVDARAAERRVAELFDEGADIIDIGAESTRPRAPKISAEEQIARIGATVHIAAHAGAIVSIDTTSPAVALRAISEGASVINSVSLEPVAELARIAVDHDAALVLMHCRGSMTDMPDFSTFDDKAYADVVSDVAREWIAAAELAFAAGLPKEEIVLDPGLGFAKNARHSLELCARLDELVSLGFPVLVGPSRKSFLARATAEGSAPPAPPDHRLGASIAAAIACVARGAAIVRVHDVEATRQALAFARALEPIAERRRSQTSLEMRAIAGHGEVANDA